MLKKKNSQEMGLLPKKVFTQLCRGYVNWEEVLRLADVHLLSICVLHDMDALAMLLSKMTHP